MKTRIPSHCGFSLTGHARISKSPIVASDMILIIAQRSLKKKKKAHVWEITNVCRAKGAMPTALKMAQEKKCVHMWWKGKEDWERVRQGWRKKVG